MDLGALDADSKLVPTWRLGDRSTADATVFIQDLADRIENRIQLTTDGHRLYLEAVEGAFGAEIDYAMLIKLYGAPPEAERRYSSPECIGTKPHRVQGDPDPPVRLDLLSRAPEPHHGDGDAAVHPAD